MQTNFDIIIIGGGPAGMTAGIYSARAGMQVLLIEKNSIGGQVSLTGSIANYPGFKKIDGFELSQNMFEQMTALGVETLFGSVDEINLADEIKTVKVGGVTYSAYSIILSMGANSRGLDVTGEKNFIGKGISYCAVCDGAFFKNKIVAVVGGGNTALEDAVYLAPIVQKLYLIHRRKEYRADQTAIDEFEKLLDKQNSNITAKLGYVVEEIKGQERVQSLVLRNVETQEREELDVDGVFVAIGRNPNTELLNDAITLDNGYVVVDDTMKTNVAGVYAAGDIVKKNLRQIATAISDGAIAGTNASNFVKKFKKGE